MKKRKRLFMRTTLFITAAVLLFLAVAAAASGPIAGRGAVIIHQFDGEQLGDGFGWVGADLGDITGDGIHDVLIPAPFFLDDTGSNFLGKFYVYSGADGALLYSEAGVGFDVFGYSAATAGDVNADGVPDYVVGALTGNYAKVYSGADHSVLLSLTGSAGEFYGGAVTGAGDVNGDGRDDILVGARNASESFTLAGKIYLFSGADGSLLWSVNGQTEFAQLGSGAGLVGDVNGDGVPDQVVGAMGAGEYGGGEAYIFSGADGSVIHTLAPERPQDAANLGLFFASGAGDYDADGVPDAFVADYNASVNGVAGTGNAFVFSGADGSILLAFDGKDPGSGVGPGRAFDDIDGDGYGDLVLGAWTLSAPVNNAGGIVVLSGQGGNHPRPIQKFVGTIENDNLGVDALPVGDMNGDGLVDFMATAVGNNFAGTDVGHVYIVTGAYGP